jgi:hypothetical protein
VHAPDTQVLGVLDITLSLVKVDEEIAAITRRTTAFAGVIILALAALLTVLVRRGILRPVRELVDGTRWWRRETSPTASPCGARTRWESWPLRSTP